jgi:L-alanine-DL-glutamate epimerase-like enolase superfamily enzyme
MERRSFLRTTMGVGIAGLLNVKPAFSSQSESLFEGNNPKLVDLKKLIPGPVIIEQIDLLKNGGDYFVRVTSKDGNIGIVKGNDKILETATLIKKLVTPAFKKSDARDIEKLVEDMFYNASAYKYSGVPLWNGVGHVELAILDLLGQIAQKPVYDLFGGAIRTEIPVYMSSTRRDTTAEKEIEWVSKRVYETGAKAAKMKIGGRMSRNADAYPGRTERLVKLARKTFGDDFILYMDSNGSYDVPKAIEVGKFLQEYGISFYEEPVVWSDFEGTKEVADALDIPVAGGEQDSSLYTFQWYIKHKGLDIVQPDMFYNGGIIRALKVAAFANQHGMKIVPHSPKNDPAGGANLQFAAIVPNLGPYQEFQAMPENPDSWYTPYLEVKKGVLKLPTAPGLGFQYDMAFINSSEKL